MAATSLTNRDIVKLYEGIVALDGQADKEGKVERFDLDDDTSWQVAKCRRILEGAVETHQKERKKLGAKHKIVEGMKLTTENAPVVADFMIACEELLDRTNELNGLLKLKLSALRKAGVKTPGILSNLMPLIDDK